MLRGDSTTTSSRPGTIVSAGRGQWSQDGRPSVRPPDCLARNQHAPATVPGAADRAAGRRLAARLRRAGDADGATGAPGAEARRQAAAACAAPAGAPAHGETTGQREGERKRHRGPRRWEVLTPRSTVPCWAG